VLGTTAARYHRVGKAQVRPSAVERDILAHIKSRYVHIFTYTLVYITHATRAHTCIACLHRRAA
jgi:hypothetical protein